MIKEEKITEASNIANLVQLTQGFKRLNAVANAKHEEIKKCHVEVDEIKKNIEKQKQQNINEEEAEEIANNCHVIEKLSSQYERKVSQMRNSNMKKLVIIAKEEKVDSCAIDEGERKLEQLVTYKDVLTRRELYLNEKSTNGFYTWKICDIISKLTEGADQDYNSLPFFLSPQGYKFRISMYRNHAYLEIKIICMKSPMDPLMEWPLRRQAKISLINPTNRSKSLTKYFDIEVLESPSNVSDEQVIAVDVKNFLPMDQIFQYILRDCIYISCYISKIV